MTVNRLRRCVISASAVAIVSILPLTLAGCGGSDGGAAATTPPKDFQATHQGSMDYYKQQQAAQKGARK